MVQVLPLAGKATPRLLIIVKLAKKLAGISLNSTRFAEAVVLTVS